MREHPVLVADDVVQLTRALVAVESVSGNERELAGLVEQRLRRRAPHLAVHRQHNSVVARSDQGRPTRLVFAGHLDTVPGRLPCDGPAGGDEVRGRGAVDMKGGLAVLLLLAEAPPGRADHTFVCYEKEETGSTGSGMKMLFDERAELVTGDAAVVLEPTNGMLEAGCQGNLVLEIGFTGTPAHTARPWRGVNAVTRAAPALNRLIAFDPQPAELDGLRYRQSLSVVGISGGSQGNVVPDRCVLRVNFRHAPHLDSRAARELVADLVPDADDVRVLLDSPPAPPALDHPELARLREIGQLPVRPKLGWTDVGRFARHGIPAVNFGPGDSELAHGPAEVVSRSDLEHCLLVLLRFAAAQPRSESERTTQR